MADLPDLPSKRVTNTLKTPSDNPPSDHWVGPDRLKLALRRAFYCTNFLSSHLAMGCAYLVVLDLYVEHQYEDHNVDCLPI